jgi:lysophospholipase L1-like esterase
VKTRRSMLLVAVAVVGSLLAGGQPALAAPAAPGAPGGSGGSRMSAAAVDTPAAKAKRHTTAFDPAAKLPQPKVIPGTTKKIAPLTSALKRAESKAPSGSQKGVALGGAPLTTADIGEPSVYNCLPSIYGGTFVGDDPSIGPYSDTIYTADVSCNFFLEYIYGVSAAVDWSPYYEGEIGYVGTAFEGAGSYGASQGAFEVQGDQYDGGRAVEVILELYLQASAPWAGCGPIPGLRYLACDGLGTLLLHVVVGTGAFGTGLAPPVVHWAALGDSYSAGTGASSYLGPPNPPACLRSAQTYSYRVNGGSMRIGDRGEPVRLDQPNLKACDGAKTIDMYFTQNNRGAETRQLDYVTKKTRLVTLTVGGNDLDFSPVLKNCFFSDCSGAPLIPPDRASRLQDDLVRLYQNIRSQMRPTNSRLVVLNYPDPLPNPRDPADDLPKFLQCPFTNSQITTAELNRVYEAAALLSNIIAGAVAQLGDPNVVFVDVLDAFRGHRVCADDEWANGISLDFSGVFHPNDRGYVKMATELILQAGIGT